MKNGDSFCIISDRMTVAMQCIHIHNSWMVWWSVISILPYVATGRERSIALIYHWMLVKCTLTVELSLGFHEWDRWSLALSHYNFYHPSSQLLSFEIQWIKLISNYYIFHHSSHRLSIFSFVSCDYWATKWLCGMSIRAWREPFWRG